MSSEPTLDSASPSSAKEWLRALRLAAIALALLAGGSWLIYFFDGLGTAADDGGVHLFGLVRFLGLAIDIGLLALWMAWLHRRDDPLAVSLGPIVILLAIILFFSVSDWYKHNGRLSFWTLWNVQSNAVQMTTVAVAALGMTVIIIAAGIDLSIGTALALCATVLAYMLDQGHGVAASITACILCGALCGVVNGVLVSSLKVVPFIVTLGTMSIFLGIGKILAKETTVRPPRDAIPQWLGDMMSLRPSPTWLMYPVLPNFGWGVWVALGLAALLAGVLHFTIFGRHVFAVGSNEATARLCGINVPLTKVAVYALAGLFVGVAGMYQFARLSSGSPTSGIGTELKVIAAVVIGGASLNGGRGSILGTLAGAAMMQVIHNGCGILGLGDPLNNIVIGVVIIAAAAVDRFRNRQAN